MASSSTSHSRGVEYCFFCEQATKQIYVCRSCFVKFAICRKCDQKSCWKCSKSIRCEDIRTDSDLRSNIDNATSSASGDAPVPTSWRVPNHRDQSAHNGSNARNNDQSSSSSRQPRNNRWSRPSHPSRAQGADCDETDFMRGGLERPIDRIKKTPPGIPYQCPMHGMNPDEGPCVGGDFMTIHLEDHVNDPADVSFEVQFVSKRETCKTVPFKCMGNRLYLNCPQHCCQSLGSPGCLGERVAVQAVKLNSRNEEISKMFVGLYNYKGHGSLSAAADVRARFYNPDLDSNFDLADVSTDNGTSVGSEGDCDESSFCDDDIKVYSWDHIGLVDMEEEEGQQGTQSCLSDDICKQSLQYRVVETSSMDVGIERMSYLGDTQSLALGGDRKHAFQDNLIKATENSGNDSNNYFASIKVEKDPHSLMLCRSKDAFFLDDARRPEPDLCGISSKDKPPSSSMFLPLDRLYSKYPKDAIIAGARMDESLQKDMDKEEVACSLMSCRSQETFLSDDSLRPAPIYSAPVKHFDFSMCHTDSIIASARMGERLKKDVDKGDTFVGTFRIHIPRKFQVRRWKNGKERIEEADPAKLRDFDQHEYFLWSDTKPQPCIDKLKQEIAVAIRVRTGDFKLESRFGDRVPYERLAIDMFNRLLERENAIATKLDYLHHRPIVDLHVVATAV